MRFPRCFRPLLLGSLAGWLCAGQGRAQTRPAADSAGTRLPTWVWKGGLRLTHLSYSRTTTDWQLLVPASVNLEYRLGSRCSLYTQLDADMQFTSQLRARRGRRAAGTPLVPAAALALGGRYYYGRPAGTLSYQREAPEFGKYLALEGGGDLTQTNSYGPRPGGVARSPNRNNAVLLSPYLFVRWGIQNCLRPHLLYDLNAGLGLVAPARPTAEYTGDNYRLDVAAQVNVSIYLAR